MTYFSYDGPFYNSTMSVLRDMLNNIGVTTDIRVPRGAVRKIIANANIALDDGFSDNGSSPMEIRWHTPYNSESIREPAPTWPAGWGIPSVGQTVVLSNGKHLIVGSVDWHPHGEDDPVPFIYIVLKQHKIGDRFYE